MLSYGQVKGKFINYENNPQKNVIIQLLNPKDSVQVKSTLSSDNGIFSISDVSSGNYLLSYTAVDNETKYRNISISETSTDIGIIMIENKNINLSEVVVTAKKPLFEPQLDKIVVNVQENLTFAGGTALEVLSRSPGVNISKERNTISLNGKNEVFVMLDGKIARLPIDALIQMLDGMPAQNIQKIELITNPGAKYDAGSTGGIINIVGLKGKNDGTNGSASLIGGWGGKERLGATGNLNHRKGNLNFYSNVAYYRNHNDQSYTIEREINNNGQIYQNNVFTDRDPLSDYFTGKIGIDCDINKSTKLGGFVSGMTDLFHLKANTDVTDTNNLGVTTYTNVKNEEKNNWSNLTTNIYLNKQLTDKQELNFDLTHLYYYNTNNLTNFNNYYNSSNNLLLAEKVDGNKNAPVNARVGTIDYSNKLTEKSKLEFGLKISTAKYNNDIKVFKQEIVDPTLTQIFTLTENIYAIYGNYNVNLTDKIELQTGLRYEYFDLKSNSLNGDIKRNSGNLFPSIYLSHKFNDKKTLQLSYNRRVSRPSYNDFAPYYVFIDPSTSFTGNENLNQSIVDGFKMDYKYSKYLLSLQYTHEDNGIARFQPQADLVNNTLFFSSLNMKYKDIYTLLFSFPVKVTPWWNIRNNFMGVKQIFRTQHLPENITFDNNYLELNSTFSFELPKKYSVEISGFYHTSKLYGFSRNKEFGNMNLAVGKKINDKHKLTLTINNLLGTYKDWDIVDEPKLNYYFNAQYNFTPFMARLTYNYTFGGNSSNSRKKGAGSEDIENRIR
jgi:hypothetical protein